MKTKRYRTGWRHAAALMAVATALMLAADQSSRAITLLFDAEYNGNTGNGGLNADSAVGSKVLTSTTGVSLTPSPFGGQAAYFPAGTSANVNLQYSTTDNIDSDKGTIEFWYRPDLGGVNEVNNNYRLFDVLNSDGTRFLDIYTSSNTANDMGIAVYNHETGGAFGDDTRSGFVAGTWVDVAVTWDDASGIQVFVNGKADGLYAGTWTPDTLASDFSVGSYGSGGSLDAAGAIDHLRIDDSVLYTTDYTPEPIPIPESSSLVLICIGGLLSFFWQQRRLNGR